MVAAALDDSEYARLFRAHLQRALARGDAELSRGGTDAPPPALVDYLLNTINFALDADDLWSEVRPVLVKLSPALEHAGRFRDGLTYLTRAVAQCRRVADDETGAELLYQLGLFHLTLGDVEAAEAAFYEGYGLASAGNRPAALARALNGMASIAYTRGNLERAEEHVLRALALADQVTRKERSAILRTLGTIASHRIEWARALDYFEQDAALWRVEDDPRECAKSLVNRGSALRALKRSDEAIAAYEEAIALFDSVGDEVTRAVVQGNLGNVYLGLRDYPAALKAYIAAEWTLREASDATRLARLYNNMGMAHSGMQAWDEAERNFTESIARWHALKNDRARLNVIDNLGELYLARGDMAQARALYADARILAAQVGDAYLTRLVEDHAQMAEQ